MLEVSNIILLLPLSSISCFFISEAARAIDCTALHYNFSFHRCNFNFFISYFSHSSQSGPQSKGAHTINQSDSQNINPGINSTNRQKHDICKHCWWSGGFLAHCLEQTCHETSICVYKKQFNSNHTREKFCDNKKAECS